MRLVRGMQKFAPVQYYSFDVGPFELTLTLQAGQSAAELYRIGMAALDEMFSTEYERALELHLVYCRRSIQEANAAGLGGRR